MLLPALSEALLWLDEVAGVEPSVARAAQAPKPHPESMIDGTGTVVASVIKHGRVGFGRVNFSRYILIN